MRSWIPAMCLAAAMLPCLVGCSSDRGYYQAPQAVVVSGSLVVDWTVDELKDPAVCTQTNAATIVIVVANAAGQTVGTFQQTCDVFATTVTLEPGTYSASAYFLDPSGAPRTTTVPIAPYIIDSGSPLDIPLDFPANSFY